MISSRTTKKFKVPQSQKSSISDSLNSLQNGILQILKKSHSNISFEELYRNSYSLVIAKKGEEAYNSIKKIMGEELRKEISKLGSHHTHEQYLNNFKMMFDDHRIVIKMIRDVLMYLDRTVVKQKNLPLCYDMGSHLINLGIHVFRDTVYSSIKMNLFECLKSMFFLLRSSEFVDKRLIKDIIEIFITIPKDSKTRSETLYSSDWEAEFLEDSRNFYQKLSSEKIGQLDAVSYLQFSKEKLEREREISEALGLLSQTKHKLIKLLEHELLHIHLEAIVSNTVSGISVLIDQNSASNLEMMYTLLGRIPSGHGRMIEAVSSHLKFLGKSISILKDDKLFHLTWMAQILSLKAKFDNLMESFGNDADFEAHIHMALQQIINIKHAPEFCSLYIDTNFKKLAKGGDVDVDVVNRNVISIFRFLNEKDLFEKYFKGHLAKRLIYSKDLMEDAEKSLLAMLKVECGTQFTSKLEGMFTDSQLSTELTRSFKNYLKSKEASDSEQNMKLPVEISLNILTCTNWPYSATMTGCNLPSELLSIVSQFEVFYHAQHSSRKLTWLKNLGTADVITQLPLFKKEKELNMSTYAMTLLVTCFNTVENEPVKFATIVEKTGIPFAELKRALQTLSLGKYKILTKLSKGREILETDSFIVNFDFNSTQTKIKILTIASKEGSKSEDAKEREETLREIDNSRKHQIEATIVRIMKSRKVMSYNLLVSDLITQLNSRFTPNVTMVKERIEELIEREFLRRDSEDRYLNIDVGKSIITLLDLLVRSRHWRHYSFIQIPKH